MNDIPFVGHLVKLIILLPDINNVDGNIIGDFARRSVLKYEKTVQLLRYDNQICYVSNINKDFILFVVLILILFSKRHPFSSVIYLPAVNE